VSVKMRRGMITIVHSNNDAKKPANFRHTALELDSPLKHKIR
jgi:hypothetical protein